jgi:pimeloyl-ACP methyl ester carboxylesterase
MPPFGYGPFELERDPARFGLVVTTVETDLGTCTARHPPTRTSARATIFIHGAAGSWTTWTPMLHAAEALHLGLGDTVMLDLPGWGDAVVTDARSEQTIEAIASLVKATAEELGYTEWDLVGHSLGGFVALHLASLWPQSVLSVGMVSGTTFAVIRSVAHPIRNFGRLPGFILLWRAMQFLAALGPVGTALVRGLGRIGLLRPITFPLFRHWRLVPKSQASALAHELRPRAFAAAARATLGYDAAGRWSTISCPVRATKGDRDVFVTNDDLSELARLLPASIRTVIPDCGHFGNVERPAEVLAALGYL